MSDSGPGRREVAYRLFAAEFDDADLSYSESDEERAPNYVVTPTGARANRLFAVGVLTEVDDVNPEMVRGRLVDPTGAFVTYAGQYQPEALAALERADPPGFFALTGKARTYEPEDGDRIYSSVRPESVSEVDGDTRDRWVVTAAERTIERVGVMASAIESGLTGDRLRTALREAGVDDRLADGVALALDHYGTTPAYLSELRDVALDAVRVVAGERDEVDRLELAPGEGAGDAGALATIELSGEPAPETAADAGESGMDGDAAGGSGIDGGTAPETDTEGSVDDEGLSSEPDPEPGEEEGATTGETAGTDPEATETTETAEASGSDVGGEPSTDAEPDGESPDEASPDPDIDSEPETVDGATDAPSETTADPDDAIGDFDETDDGIGGLEEEPDPEDLDPGEFELDEEERREVEDEFGTEFSTADEIEPADIEPEGATGGSPEGGPGSDPVEAASGADPEDTPEVEAEAEIAERPPDTAGEPTAAGDEGSAPADEIEEAVDLDDAVMALMSDLDDGDGVDRDALIEAVVDAHGADPEAVDEAIQDALMSGQCYEPADDTLKPI